MKPILFCFLLALSACDKRSPPPRDMAFYEASFRACMALVPAPVSDPAHVIERCEGHALEAEIARMKP